MSPASGASSRARAVSRLPRRTAHRAPRRAPRWIASLTAGALVAGVLTVGGITAERAAAAAPAPAVAVTPASTFVVGEDIRVDVVFTSAGPSAGDQYNLSAGVLLPEAVAVRDSTLGTPIVYPKSATDRTVPLVVPDCTVYGLEPRTGGAPGCQVPDGMQYLAFANVSDLPEGARAAHSLTLRPEAAAFPVGSTDLLIQVTAATSGDERYLPALPGLRSVASSGTHSSAAGSAATVIPVEALRIEKSEPSPENELLRGVHANSTTYTLRIHRSGEGDLSDVVVTDFLPAGLEYLGLGGIDNTTNANGTAGGPAEYPGAPSLAATPAPAGSGPNAAASATETVETVIPTAAEVAAYGLEAGKVYTKVTWRLGDLLAAGTALDVTPPLAQVYPSAAGEAGVIELRYRAAVPLFENTLDFDGAGGQPAITGAQAANLDNNRGASTRHGSPQTTPGFTDDGSAHVMTNVAHVSGTYQGAVAPGLDGVTSDTASETIEAVDVRVIKAVDDAEFQQGRNARYTVTVATSEYTSAVLGTGPSSVVRPNRLVDDLADGICPAFPADVAITPGASTAGVGIPRLVIGDPGTPGSLGPDLTPAEWNAELGPLGSDCVFPSSSSGTELTGATLTGIAFDPATGHFFLDLSIPPIDAGSEAVVVYTARQNSVYAQNGGAPGATTSGDVVTNTAEALLTTESIPALAGVTSAGAPLQGVSPAVADGTWRAGDDSTASLEASLSRLTKHVLLRSAGSPDPADLPALAASNWVKEADPSTPFAVGDEVWYRIVLTPPSGADVRNPKLVDFLPDGVAFDPALGSDGRPANIWILPSNTDGLGTCAPADVDAWLDTFVPTSGITVSGNVVTFLLGSDDCIDDGTNDRFLPLDSALTLYMRVTVTDPAEFADVDISENLVKYQQNNVAGEIYFLRDQADIAIDGGVQLVKGLRSNTHPSSASAGSGFPYLSNVDGTPTTENVVQGDEATFRLDIVGSRVDTTDYVVWDALPAGIVKDDVKGLQADGTFTSATAEIVTQTWVPSPGSGTWVATETPVASGWTARVYDPTDAGYPAEVRSDIRDAGRSVIVWTFGGVVPGAIAPDDEADPAIPGAPQGLTLGYTLVVPAAAGRAAELSRQYRNDASVVGFSYVDSAGGRTPIVVNGDDSVAVDRPASSGGFAFDDEDGTASDTSSVYVPDTTPTKSLVSTEVGPATQDLDSPVNTDGRIVQGEYAVFEYRVEIPAHTTVRGAVLSDGGALRFGTSGSIPYEFVDGSAQFALDGSTLVCGTTAADFRCAQTSGTSHGVLTFPDTYTNDTDDAQVFSVRITAWVKDRDAANTTATQISHNTTFRNTATFSYLNPNSATGARISHDAQASAVYYEFQPTIAKTASQTEDVAVGDEVAYTITVRGQSGRAATYDAVVVDTIPAGLEVKPGSFTVGGAPLADALLDLTGDVFSGDGGTITWRATAVPGLAALGGPVVLGYIATISETTGGGAEYLNSATVTGYSLPAELDGLDTTGRRGVRSSTAEETITATTATLEKGVRIGGTGVYAATATAPIGETASYEVRVVLHADINYYDASIVDQLPAGVELVGTPTVTATDASVDADDWTFVPPASGSTTWRLDFVGGDIPRSASDREVVVTYDVRLTDAIAATTGSISNTASFTWGPRDGAPAAERTSIDDTATVTVPHPFVELAKSVKAETDDEFASTTSAEVDETLTYRLRVGVPAGTASTPRTPAYNTVITDTVPAGLVVDTASFTIDGDAASPTWTAGVTTGAGGTITWTLEDAIDPGTAVELLYTASFVDAASLTAGGKTNLARVTSYDSFPAGGRTYGPHASVAATATPLTPLVELTKTAVDSSRTAYVGEPFAWELRARAATGPARGAAQTVVLTDTLPANWSFGEVTSITVNGVAQPLTDPTETSPGVLEWTFGSPAVDGSPAAILQPGQSIVIRYTAIPDNPEALTAPGVGSSTPHTNTLSAVTTDRRGATGLGTGSYTGPDASDDAFLREADLRLVKDAIGGVVAVQTAPTSKLRDLPVGTWVAGQSPEAGVYAQPQWRITLTNQGPDAGVGPFRIVDTTTLPDGVTTGSWTARYYASAADTTGTPLTVTGAGTVASPFVVGTASTSLAADGSSRIVLTANVTIDEDAEPGSRIANSASATGRTYEDPDNLDDNTDDAEKTLVESADLEIVKTIATPAPTSVGESITWSIAIRNLGPSTSRSETDAITVTDTIPAGVTGVTALSNTDWAATLADGSPIPTEGVGAGTQILWTYQGDQLEVGRTTTVSLTGTILTAHVGEIENTATVHAGDTDDPVSSNDSSSVDIEPRSETTLDVTKTRVVWDAEAEEWVAAASLSPVPAVVPGEPVSYLVTVANLGPADARNVVVVDETPVGLAYASHTESAHWTRTAGGTSSTSATSVPQWDTFALDGTVPAHESTSFVVTYSTSSELDPADSVANCVETRAGNWLTTAAQRFDRACDSSSSSRVVDLGISKSHTAAPGNGRYAAGALVPYTITVTNHGPSATGGPIEIVDELPAGTSYEAGTARVAIAGGTAASLEPDLSGTDDRVLTWEVDLDGQPGEILAVGATIVVTLSVRIDADVRDGVVLINTAEVAGPETEPLDDPHPNTTTDSVTAKTDADVTIVKSVEAGPWVAGTDVAYELEITNDGPSSVPATVVDELPEGLTLVSMAGTGWDCSGVVAGETAGACTYNANDGLLPVGTTTITVVAHLASSVPAGTELENTAEVSWTDEEGSHSDDDSAQIEASAVSDLALTKLVRPTLDSDSWIDAQTADDAGQAVAGREAEFRLVITNDGPSAAVAPLVIEDVLPAGVAFVGLVGSPDWTATVDDTTRTVTFTRDADLGGIPLDGQVDLVYTVMLAADLAEDAVLTNTAALAKATLDANDDPNAANDGDPAVIEVAREVDVRLEKSHDADTVRIGDQLVFSLVATNAGPSQASGIVVTDTLPAGLVPLDEPGTDVGAGWTLESVTLTDPDDPGAGAVIVARYADVLDPDAATEPLLVRTTVLAAAYPSVVNEALVAVTEEDVDPSNDAASDEVVVPPLVTLEIVKSVATALRVGQQGAYRITVTNHGPTEDPGALVVTDALPAGLTFVAAEGDRFTCAEAAGVVECVLDGALAIDETVELRLEVMVDDAAFPEVENVATVATDSELTEDSITESSVVSAVAERLATTGVSGIEMLALWALLATLLGAALIAVRRVRTS